MLANCFPRPNIADWSARARREAESKSARTKVIRRPLTLRPGRGLDRENLLVIPSHGRTIIERRAREASLRQGVSKPGRSVVMIAPILDRRQTTDPTPRAYHAAPENIGAGRI
jgi:hypothetical protein